MILIGSAAIKHWFPDFPRNPKDIDYAFREGEIFEERFKGYEYLKNPVLCSKYTDNDIEIISENDLYTLKVSHLFWDINWEKHMFDVQFLKSKECTLDTNLFYKLYDYWNIIHGKNKRSNLKMSAEDFFDNAVKCEYSHDWLHTLLKNPPTYTKILKDGAEVEVSEDKFNILSFEEKCDLVREEVMVMAWERYSRLDYRMAYGRMLKKFIISHCPIWEGLFIIENFVLLHKPNFNYKEVIENGLKEAK